MSEKRFEDTSRRRGSVKKAIAGVLAIVLVAVVSVVGTLAYLGTQSDEKKNTFTGSAGIKLGLVEPNFETTQTSNTESERVRAGKYTPGGEYLKDPMLYNSSNDNGSEWVAMKVSFELDTNKDGNLETATWGDLKKIAKIQYKDGAIYKDGFASSLTTPKWFLIHTSSGDATLDDADTYAIFMYQDAIVKNAASVTDTSLASAYTSGSITTPLFDKVTILDQTSIENSGFYNSTSKVMPKFQIDIIGAAIKNEYTYSSEGSAKLATAFSEVDPTEQENIKNELKRLLGVIS